MKGETEEARVYKASRAGRSGSMEGSRVNRPVDFEVEVNGQVQG